MHTHRKDGDVQFAVTLTWETTKVEKKSKDASGAATGRIRRDISFPSPQRVLGVTWHGNDDTQLHRFECPRDKRSAYIGAFQASPFSWIFCGCCAIPEMETAPCIHI